MNKEYKCKVYFDLLKRDPENISVRMSLAYITAMEGDLDSAEEIYKSLWNNNPDNSEILVNYINVLIANNNLSEAKNLIKTLKEKFQENKNIESFEKKIEELSKEVLEDFTEKSPNNESSSSEN
jgi:thioredoxin-like negative regulator of GroEL